MGRADFSVTARSHRPDLRHCQIIHLRAEQDSLLACRVPYVHSGAISTFLNSLVYRTDSSDAQIAEKTLEIVGNAKDRWLTVAKIIPQGEYHRHSYTLGPVLRSLTTNVVFSRFVLTDELIPAFQVSDLIGCTSCIARGGEELIRVEQPETKDITLTAEDYLIGVIGMVNELVSGNAHGDAS